MAKPAQAAECRGKLMRFSAHGYSQLANGGIGELQLSSAHNPDTPAMMMDARKTAFLADQGQK